MGQSYSFQQTLPSGHRAWQFSRTLDKEDVAEMLGSEVEARDAELFIKAIFRAVPLSCMDKAPERPVSGAERPIEFDSQLRQAA